MVGFFNSESHAAFMALFLERTATNHLDPTSTISAGCRTDQNLRIAPVDGSTLAGGFSRVPVGERYEILPEI